MVNLVGYATPYWLRLLVGILAAFCTRFARLVPPIIVAAAIDRVVLSSGEPGLLTDAGLLPPGQITGEAARIAFLQRLVAIAAIAYLLRSRRALPPDISSSRAPRRYSGTSGTTPTTTCNTSRCPSLRTTRPAG